MAVGNRCIPDLNYFLGNYPFDIPSRTKSLTTKNQLGLSFLTRGSRPANWDLAGPSDLLEWLLIYRGKSYDLPFMVQGSREKSFFEPSLYGQIWLSSLVILRVEKNSRCFRVHPKGR